MEFENLLKLINTVSDSKLTGFKNEENGVKISLSKRQDTKQTIVTCAEGIQTAAIPAGAPVMQANAAGQVETGEYKNNAAVQSEGQPEAQKAGQIVKAPLVGVFYAAPAEDAAPFVTVGDRVKKGQTLAIIEAMKLMNEIDSEYDGTIAEILVENGQAVEYGQPLFRIEA